MVRLESDNKGGIFPTLPPYFTQVTDLRLSLTQIPVLLRMKLCKTNDIRYLCYGSSRIATNAATTFLSGEPESVLGPTLCMPWRSRGPKRH